MIFVSPFGIILDNFILLCRCIFSLFLPHFLNCFLPKKKRKDEICYKNCYKMVIQIRDQLKNLKPRIIDISQ